MDKTQQILDTESSVREVAQLQLEWETRNLERVKEELECFLGVATNDLRAPIRSIAGCTHLLEEQLQGKLDEQTERVLELMGDGGTRRAWSPPTPSADPRRTGDE